MTEQQFFSKFSEIEKEYNLKIKELKNLYVSENTKYQIGDIIEDHFHKIKIESFKTANLFNDELSILYIGTVLTKNNKPAKNQINNIMFGSNVKGGWKK